jgi:IS5 family transposase
VDAGTGYIHSLEGTAANVHDIVEASKLIRPDDEVVYGDAGYLGIQKRPEIAEDEHMSTIEYRINQRPGKIRKLAEGPARDWFGYEEYRKSSVRSKVEHAFHIIKNTFGFNKVCYRGIAKNLNRLYLLAASANLLMCARSGGWRRQML